MSEPVRVVVTGLRAPRHAVHAHTYLADLAGRTEAPVGVEVLGPRPAQEGYAERLLSLDGRLALRHTDRLPDPDPAERVVLLGVGALDPVLAARLTARRRRRAHGVVVDEGLASYGGPAALRAERLREGRGRAAVTVRSVAQGAASRVLETERWALYRRTSAGSWRVSRRVGDPMRQLLTGQRGRPGRAVYLTRPWVDLGLLTQEGYLDHLSRTRAALARSGLDLVVRPHESEDPARYADFECLPVAGPAELDRAVVGADVVLGNDSTSLLALAAIWLVPAIRMRHRDLAGLEPPLRGAQPSLVRAYVPRTATVAELATLLARLGPFVQGPRLTR